jgi:outer membrane immunogenic protein
LIVAGVLLGTAGAQAGSSHQWTGAYLGFEADFDAANVTYTNTGTPHQDMSGGLLGVQAGYDFEMGPLVVGLAGDATFGNLNAFVRDGNYITESGKINALGLLRGRVGLPMGNMMPYFTGGAAFTSLQQGETCPEPAAAPFGFCHTHGPFDVSGSKTLVGATIGGGVEAFIAPGWTVQAQYLHTFFPEASYVLGPDGNGNPLPASVAHLGMDEGTVAFLRRF